MARIPSTQGTPKPPGRNALPSEGSQIAYIINTKTTTTTEDGKVTTVTETSATPIASPVKSRPVPSLLGLEQLERLSLADDASSYASPPPSPILRPVATPIVVEQQNPRPALNEIPIVVQPDCQVDNTNVKQGENAGQSRYDENAFRRFNTPPHPAELQRPTIPGRKPGYYLVTKGREVGIYSDWNKALALTTGITSAPPHYKEWTQAFNAYVDAYREGRLSLCVRPGSHWDKSLHSSLGVAGPGPSSSKSRQVSNPDEPWANVKEEPFGVGELQYADTVDRLVSLHGMGMNTSLIPSGLKGKDRQ